MLPLTVGVASALLVFSALVFAFGDVGATTSSASSATPSNGAVTTVAGVPAEPGPPRVVRGAVSREGELVTLAVPLERGDELRVKVVPGEAFDPQVGLTMPKDRIVADFFQQDFEGDVQRLFPIQNGLLYSDTLTPSSTVALEANDLGKEGAAEWLVFVAPTAGDYSVVVRGKGRSTGSYDLTVQTRKAAGAAAAAKRLAVDPEWLDRDATRELAAGDLPFLLDPAFYDDAEFRIDGTDTRPTREGVENLIATGT